MTDIEHPFFGWAVRLGAAVSRFKRVKRKVFRKPRVLVFGLGRKLPSVKGQSFAVGWENLRGFGLG